MRSGPERKKERKKEAFSVVLRLPGLDFCANHRRWLAEATAPARTASPAVSGSGSDSRGHRCSQSGTEPLPLGTGASQDTSDKLGIWRVRKRDEERGRAPGRDGLAHMQWRQGGPWGAVTLTYEIRQSKALQRAL